MSPTTANTECHIASFMLAHYLPDISTYHLHFYLPSLFTLVRLLSISYLSDAATYFSFVALKIWVRETLFPLDVPPSTVSKVELCPAT